MNNTMIPFSNLPQQYQSLKAEIDSAVLRVLASGNYASGPEVQIFENSFCEFTGAKYAMGVSSGTSALQLALLAAGIKAGDEVITVPLTFVATVAAIQYIGAVAKLVDVDPVTWTMDVNKLEAALTEKTKALIPVHMHGQMANMDAICAFAKKHNLIVIEDAAQAHDAYYKGKHAGTMGDLGCFSFYPGKNLGACGEGGMVVTNNAEYAEKVRMLRDWGQQEKSLHVLKGYNYRMDGIQGAILDVKLKQLKHWTQLRRKQAAIYDQAFKHSDFLLPAHQEDCLHSYHIYSICTPQRDLLRQELQQKGIATALHYARPVHYQPAYADLGYKPGSLPVSEHLIELFLSLPIYAELSEEQAKYVAATTLAILEKSSCAA